MKYLISTRTSMHNILLYTTLFISFFILLNGNASVYVESQQSGKSHRLFPPSLIPDTLRVGSGHATGIGRAAGTAHTLQLPTHLKHTNSVPVAGSETAADSRSATDFKTKQLRANDLVGLKHTKTAPVDLSCLRKSDEDEDDPLHEGVPVDSALDSMENLEGISFPVPDLHALATTFSTGEYATRGYMGAVGGVNQESLSEAALTGIHVPELHSKILTDPRNKEARRTSGAGLRRLSVELNEIVPIQRRSSTASLALLRRRASYKVSHDRVDGGDGARSREDSESRIRGNILLDSATPVAFENAAIGAHVRSIGILRCPPSERRTLGRLVKNYGTRVVLI